jgi:tetratricopeptide (TPR) repeat protein
VNGYIYDSTASSTHELVLNNIWYTRTTKITTLNNEIFVNLPDSNVNELKNKWIQIPENKYTEFGQFYGDSPLFENVLQKTNSIDERIRMKMLKASKKTGLFVVTDTMYDDKAFVADATRVTMHYNTSSIVPFYKELAKTLTVEERALTILDFKGFEKALSKKSFVKFIADNSYSSIWIDNKTKLPVRSLESFRFENPKNKREVYVGVTDAGWSKINAQVDIKKPSNVVPFTEGAKKLGVYLMPNIEELFTDLTDLKVDLKKAKTNEEKARIAHLIAVAYEMINMYEEAAKYYKEEATYYKKNSVEYYDVLALAEWSLNNGGKAKEYFELAYKTDPDDFQLQWDFGKFLTGLTPASAPYQDLDRALALNEGWEDTMRFDENLISLYVTYILQGEEKDAKALIRKFEDFKTGDNYLNIARAYHRMGKQDKVKEYVDLALKTGSDPSKIDNDFFSMKFK